MSEVAGGAAAPAPAAPAQSGQTTYAPAQQRARVGEFNAFSAGIMPQLSQQPVHGADGIPGQGIAVQNAEVLDRGYDAQDPFDQQFSGQDAQAQALAVEGQQYDEQGQPIEQPLQAQVVNREEIQAWLSQRQQWIDADDLPEEFQGKFVTARVDGKNYRIPVTEAVKGYQLQADYSNKLRELYAYRDALQQREAGLQKLLVDMDDGQKFLDAMVFLGKFEGFSKAAIIYGTQLDAERRMTPEQRQVHQALRAQRAHLQRLEIENRNLRAMTAPQQQAQQQGPTAEQIQQIYFEQLKYIAPKVAAKIGFVNTPMAQREFELHFNNMLPSIQGQDLTSEFVETVMIAAMQSVDAHLQRSGYGPAQPPTAAAQMQPRVPAGTPQGGQYARRQLPPVSQLPGSSSSAAQPRPARARIGDFPTSVARRPGR